jgi:hypothetical protein
MSSAKYLLLLLLAFATATNACPDKCICEDSSISCSNLTKEEFDQLVAGLNSSVINRVSVNKCASPLGRIDAFSKDFRVRSLEISGCGVTGFGSDAFKFLSNDLIELRLSNNSLTSMPFLQNLRRLEVLNLNNNSVCLSV